MKYTAVANNNNNKNKNSCHFYRTRHCSKLHIELGYHFPRFYKWEKRWGKKDYRQKGLCKCYCFSFHLLEI